MRRDVETDGEWQCDDIEPMLGQDLVPMLPNIAEGTSEVIPMEHRSTIPDVKIIDALTCWGHFVALFTWKQKREWHD